ncbi:hypothetical protein JOM56_005447 [Amanita muscaria]
MSSSALSHWQSHCPRIAVSEMNREITSKAFTHGLEKLITDHRSSTMSAFEGMNQFGFGTTTTAILRGGAMLGQPSWHVFGALELKQPAPAPAGFGTFGQQQQAGSSMGVNGSKVQLEGDELRHRGCSLSLDIPPTKQQIERMERPARNNLHFKRIRISTSKLKDSKEWQD